MDTYDGSTSEYVKKVRMNLTDYHYSWLVGDDRHLAESLRMNIDLDYRATHDARMAITALLRIFTQDVEQRVVSHPTTWWDSVLDRWLPKWARRYVSVNVTTHTFDVKAYYPNLAMPADEPVKYISHCTISPPWSKTNGT